MSKKDKKKNKKAAKFAELAESEPEEEPGNYVFLNYGLVYFLNFWFKVELIIYKPPKHRLVGPF